MKEKPDAGYAGAPEPLINQVQTEGGWPNYVWRLVYPSVPLDVNELTLVIPVLQNMPAGAAPENWEITLRLKPAPPEMTFAPITVLPTINASTTETGEAVSPAPSNVATLNGFTFQLDNVVELEDGFVFTGNLSWDASAFPTGKGMISEAVIPTLIDASGQQIPIEEVHLDVPHIFVFDGQLFHGDFTCLFLMACSPQTLQKYVYTVLQLAQPLHPLIIYFYQADVAQALDRIGAQRGQGWIESQVAWKVTSPYGQQRGLVGVDGWKQLYQDYRQLTDMCLQTLQIFRLEIKTSAGEWSTYQRRICTFFDLPFIPEPIWQHWLYKLYDYLVDIC